ncbi:MAG: hydantoinase B/oxoprolinase family protein [Betaproteobacteria bacterium]|nr:hydantoinase B/oxoprolinase family protein [Betaproteobacteria bacterium]
MNKAARGCVDPIVVEIIKGALKACGDEMESVIVRTSMSPFIREKGDHFSGLTDRHARLLYTTNDRAGPGMIEAIWEKYPADAMKPGDVYWMNDPYLLRGAISHLPDMCFIAPAFFGAELIGFSLCFGHFWDIGGSRPGSISPNSTDIFQEGLAVPQVRIVDQGRLNDDLYRTILRNSRFPEMLEGDTRAMMAATKIGQSRLAELFERYGHDLVEGSFEELLSRSEKVVRKHIAQYSRPGRYTFADYVDDDCVTDTPYRIELSVEIKGDGVALVDCTGSDNQAKGPINYLLHPDICRMMFSRFLLRDDRSVFQNQGAYRSIAGVKLRAGSILQPTRPAPMGLRAHTLHRFLNGVLGVFAQATDGGTPAGSPDYVIVIIHTLDPQTGKYVLCTDGLGVGQGARPFADGLDVIYSRRQKNYPIEFLEGTYAMRIERYGIAPDSGGPGKYRGGLGIIRDYRVLADNVTLATRMANRKTPPWGVKGGQAGRTGGIWVNPGRPGERFVPGFSDGIKLNQGDLVRVVSTGGGGYGDPLDREPAQVEDDVADGFVSLAAALTDYGVALDPKTLCVDRDATLRTRLARRAQRKGPLPFFDRGPQFEAMESRRLPQTGNVKELGVCRT